MTIGKLFNKAIIAGSAMMAFQSAIAMQVPMPKDPYQYIRYGNAFDQKTLYKEYAELMSALGCSKNVSQDITGIASGDTSVEGIELNELTSNAHQSNDIVIDMRRLNNYMPLPNEQERIAKDLKSYEADCLKNLNWARRMSLARPGIYAITEMGLVGGGAAISIYALGTESFGGSFAGFAAIFESLRLLRGTIQSGYDLISWPDNQLEDLENYFAKNKCYIPYVLWPRITEAFVEARHNEFSRETHTNFLKFVLGFTTYKPKQSVRFKNGISADQAKWELNNRIDEFFVDYKIEHCAKAIAQIKINISKFIDYMLNDEAGSTANKQLPRYLHLHGSGGIGKTHFVQTLTQWIDELIPGSVRFEDLVITGADELEGTPQKAGAFLRVLRNQLIENKRGSIVIVDEATWLNDDGMVSPAKRTFNGDRSKLSTSYFGTGIDGTGITLDMPPMLIFVASNEEIKDKALATRFDIVQYPNPKQEKLISYAAEYATKSIALKNAQIVPEKSKIQSWVEKLKDADVNFRHIASNIEVMLLHEKEKTS